jgi:GDP-L-fucose synthase
VNKLEAKNILVTGGSGMLGNALRNILHGAVYLSSEDGDLRDKDSTEAIFEKYRPDMVVHMAGRVGGIKANMNHLGEFYYDNIMINTNVLEACRKYEVEKALSILSTCVYPDSATYPLTEEQIHNGHPHHSNYAYAHAKRMLDVQSRAYRDQYGCNFITAVPNNLFGMHDNFDLENSHVLPAMIRKIYEAKRDDKIVTLWGDGSPLREFTYSIDMARIIIFLLENYNGPAPINVGNTTEYSIKSVADMITEILEFKGKIVWDTSGPPGQFRKPSSNSNLTDLGWSQDNYTDFYVALKTVCKWFESNYDIAKGVIK